MWVIILETTHSQPLSHMDTHDTCLSLEHEKAFLNVDIINYKPLKTHSRNQKFERWPGKWKLLSLF